MMHSKQLSKDFIKEFLELYHSLECLWNTKLKEYNDRTKKQEAYDVLIEKLKEVDKDANRETVIKKIDSFRSCFRKEIKKINLSKKIGPRGYKPRLWYFQHLAFLLEEGLPARKRIAASFHEEPEQELTIEKTIEIPTIAIESATFMSPQQQQTPTKAALNSHKKCFFDNNHCCETRNLDEFGIIGENIANKLRKLPQDKVIVVEKLITDILFEAQFGNVNSFTRINLFDMRSDGYHNTVTTAQEIADS